MNNTGGGGVLTVAVPLVDSVPTVAVIVYEPEALSPSVRGRRPSIATGCGACGTQRRIAIARDTKGHRFP